MMLSTFHGVDVSGGTGLKYAGMRASQRTARNYRLAANSSEVIRCFVTCVYHAQKWNPSLPFPYRNGQKHKENAEGGAATTKKSNAASRKVEGRRNKIRLRRREVLPLYSYDKIAETTGASLPIVIEPLPY